MFLDILGAGTSKAHVDLNFSDFMRGFDFERDLIKSGVETSENDRHQKKVGGDVIFGKPADHVVGIITADLGLSCRFFCFSKKEA
jgi:hypothetical protein